VTISPEPITVTANNQSVSYGTLPALAGSTQYTVTSGALQNSETIGSVTLTISGSGPAGAPPSGTTNEWAVGANTIPASTPYTLTPGAATGGTFNPANYAITYAPGTLTVNPVPLTIAASAEAKTYGSALTFGAGSTAFTVSPTPFPNSQTSASLTVTMTDNNNGGLATAPVSGTYPLTPSLAVPAVGDAGTNFSTNNYTITYTPGALTVNSATATVTANGQSTAYGVVIPSGPGSTLFTYSPLQNGETIGTVTLTAADTATTPVGAYPGAITPSVATGGSGTEANYNFTYVSGTLTVTNNYAPFLVTSNYLTNGNLEVCWQSVPGVVYNVLTNTTMDALGAANPSSPVTANSTNTCVTISGVSGTNVFVLIKQN
jgi:hypothetical protein